MATTEQKKKLLKAKIAVALHDELGRVPKTEEIDQVFLLAPWLAGMVILFAFEFIEGNTVTRTGAEE